MKLRIPVVTFALSVAALAQTPRPSDIIKTSAGDLRITPITHATLLLQAGGKNIYLDPAQGSFDGLPQADLILITDIHGDHMSQPNIDKIRKDSTIVFGPKAVSEKVRVDTVIANGETKEWGVFKIQAVPAYNLTRGPAAGQLYHDKGRGNGYILTYGGKNLYFSGDTEGVPEVLALKNIDVAFICMNLPFTMTPEEAAVVVKKFHPAIVYPYHYKGTDLTKFTPGLEGSGVEVRLREWYPK